MIKQLIIDGKKSYDDFNVYIGTRNISQPKKKSIKETVPFSNVVYDFSKIDGELYWEERTLKYEFDIAELTTEEMEVAKSKLLSWLLNVHDTDIYDPYIGDYHFHGSYDSDSWTEDFEKGTITVSFSVYPYKISNSDNSIIETLEGEATIESGSEIEDTSYSQMRELSIYGASHQETTEGVNLIDWNGGTNNKVTKTFVNDVLTVTGDGSSTYQNWNKNIYNLIKDNAGKTLCFNYEKIEREAENSTGTIAQITVYHNDGTSNKYVAMVNGGFVKFSYEIPTDVSNIRDAVFSIYTTNSSTPVANTIIITKPMLYFGELDNPPTYEPYTNGASPNPDYPQEIKTLDGIENLYNYKDVYAVDVTADEEGWITITYDNTEGTSVKYLNYWTNNLNLELSKEYNIITEIKEVTGTGKLLVTSMKDNTEQFSSNISFDFEDLSNGDIKTNLATTHNDFTSSTSGLRTFVQFNIGQSGSITFRLSVLKDVITDDKFKYSSYGKRYLRVDTKSPNLYDFTDLKEKSNEVTIDNEGWITCTYDNTVGSKSKYLNYYTHNLDLKTNTNYIVVVEIKEVIGKGSLYAFSNHQNGGQFTSSAYLGFEDLTNGLVRVCKGITRDDFTDVDYGTRTFVEFSKGRSGSITFRLSVFEDTSITADTFKYCGYGEDSILIDMDDNELVQIGDVKDELIIDGSTTKIVKRIGKVVLDGSEDWVKANNFYYWRVADMFPLVSGGSTIPNLISTHFIPRGFDYLYGALVDYGIALHYSTSQLAIRHKDITTLEEFKTWLSQNNVEVYYVLAEPNEIELTNVELPYTFNKITQITINDELDTTLDVSYNEKKTLIINNVSSHRIAPTIISEGEFTITLNNQSYSVGKGTYNSGFYLESGINEVVIGGVGSIAFKYKDEVF